MFPRWLTKPKEQYRIKRYPSSGLAPHVDVNRDRKDKARELRSGTIIVIISSLVKVRGNKLLPSGFTDGDELFDRLIVHAHGIVDGELISGQALVDVTTPTQARNFCDARERGAVVS